LDQVRIDWRGRDCRAAAATKRYAEVVRSWSAFLVALVGGALSIAAPIQPTVSPVGLPSAADQAARAVPLARGLIDHPDDPPRSLTNDPAALTSAYIAEPDGPLRPAAPGETRSVAVVVNNESDTIWSAAGSNPVKLSYHLYDATGKLLAWDGLRTALPHDIVPGFGGLIPLEVALPTWTGTYTVKPDLIREGKTWFSASAQVGAGFPLRVTTDLDAGYGPTTAPTSIVPGGEVNIEVPLTNTGLRTWAAGGDHPIRLGYHWFDMSSQAIVWDGARTRLPHDVAPGETVRVTVDMRAPDAEGAYALGWDMVEEGAHWFSAAAVPMREDLVVVRRDGVTLYGKGWGHGIGLSQWGAQGWAEGVTGVRLGGEQIVAKYFPGAQLATQPLSLPFRVLLSAPSTGCVGRTIWDVARMSSAGGMRLVNNADPSVVYFEASPDEPIRFVASGSTLIATDAWSGRRVYMGEDIVTLVPTQWWDPIAIDEKGLAYRGNLQIQTRDEGYLRVVNFVSSDDYMRGALPGEMPGNWEYEALRAQAITARTYAAWRQATAGDRTWDVRDDTADQCYGGHSFENPRASAAVASTASLILTYAGQPIRALYASSSGGISENVGCVLDAERVGGTWRCAKGWPYLAVVADPAEALAYDPRGQNPHDELWARTFSGPEIRDQIIEDYGVDIGDFVAMQFNLGPGGRPVSVVVRGTQDFVDLKGDRFLRTTLGLKSTLVRAIPF
jgi:stage II sporulation protein D